MTDFTRLIHDERLHQIRQSPRQHCDVETIEDLADTLLVARDTIKLLQEKLAEQTEKASK